MAKALEAMPLAALDVARNHMRCQGARALGLALQRSCSLQQLSVRANGIMESGALALAVALKTSTCLQQVDLRGNRFPFSQVKIQAMLQHAPHAKDLLVD